MSKQNQKTEDKTVKVVEMNIGQYSRDLILKGGTNDEILEQVLKTFPKAKTTKACIAWYKSDLRKKGLLERKVNRTQVKVTV